MVLRRKFQELFLLIQTSVAPGPALYRLRIGKTIIINKDVFILSQIKNKLAFNPIQDIFLPRGFCLHIFSDAMYEFI